MGIGKPSKYFALPVLSFGNEAAVTLNLASRDTPERRKNERMRVSTVVRRPSTYATTDGATPNETYKVNVEVGRGGYEVCEGI